MFGIHFDEAVSLLSEGKITLNYTKPPTKRIAEKYVPIAFTEPVHSEQNAKAFAYLRSRGISAETLSSLIEQGLIYQSEVDIKTSGKQIPVAVFPIFDKDGTMVGADSVGTFNLQNFKFKHVYPGTDPNYAWRFANNVKEITEETPMFFCESPIDAISLFELYKYDGVYV